jgi:hypothetical protein
MRSAGDGCVSGPVEGDLATVVHGELGAGNLAEADLQHEEVVG